MTCGCSRITQRLTTHLSLQVQDTPLPPLTGCRCLSRDCSSMHEQRTLTFPSTQFTIWHLASRLVDSRCRVICHKCDAGDICAAAPLLPTPVSRNTLYSQYITVTLRYVISACLAAIEERITAPSSIVDNILLFYIHALPGHRRNG